MKKKTKKKSKQDHIKIPRKAFGVIATAIAISLLLILTHNPSQLLFL